MRPPTANSAQDRAAPSRADCLKVLARARHAPFRVTRHALLALDAGLVFKFCRPQTYPKDLLRRYVGWTQAAREMRGAHALLRAGVRCPRVVAAYGFADPRSDFESVLVSEFVADAQPAEEVLARLGPGTPTHRKLVESIAGDIAAMARAGLLFKDLHLNNVLVARDGAPVWIDTDVKRVGLGKAAAAALCQALERLVSKGEKALGESGAAALRAAADPRRS